MTQVPRVLSVLLCIWVLLALRSATAADKWVRVESSNFVLVGNAGEKDIRKIATQLEQFRLAFSKIFTNLQFHSSVPTVVLVFKNNNAFRAYKPVYQGKPSELAGFFQPGPDINFIALTSEFRESYPFATVFHEYIHFLTKDLTSKFPAWVGEGLAEYYSTFEMSDGDRKVLLGKPIENHILLLRQERLLPLSLLLTVTHDSPYYNEKSKQGIFYAQSWALVHYLMVADQARHRPQFGKYLNLAASGRDTEESFQQAFQQDYAAMESELKAYVQRSAYTIEVYPLPERVAEEREMRSSPLSESEAQTYLGDFLLHSRRSTEAEVLLKTALGAQPDLAAAQAALGLLCMRDKRLPEAKRYLERAVALDSRNYLAHYYYAELLSRGGGEEDVWMIQTSPETIGTVRSELKKAIELAPEFLESYRLLAYVNVKSGEDLEETLLLLQKARKLFPGKEEIALSLAEVYLRKNDFVSARRLLESIAGKGDGSPVQDQARDLLDQLDRMAAQEQLLSNIRARILTEPRHEPVTGTTEAPNPTKPRLARNTNRVARPPELIDRRQMADTQGEKVSGILTHIECSPSGLTFLVKSGGRTRRFFSARPETIFLYSKGMEDIGPVKMNCGPYTPATSVVVTFTEALTGCQCDGVPSSILFTDTEPIGVAPR